MSDSVQAIVRLDIKDSVGLVPAGSLVHVARKTIQAGMFTSAVVPFTWGDRLGDLRWAPKRAFLPLSRFLALQPLHNFWALAQLNRLQKQDPNYFLMLAKDHVFGRFPFHFDSLGEVLYYIKLHNLAANNFYIAHLKRAK